MDRLSRLIAYSLLLFNLGGHAQNLPPEIDTVLSRARVPKEAIALYVIEANPSVTTPLLSHRASDAMNPASTMKLVTTVAALDLLGPTYTWQTQVLQEPNGDLVIKGGGDPKLVVERLWLLLQRVRSLGINHIHGNIVLDSSAFSVPATNPAAFDNQPIKPYNASPDALLVNYKSVVMTFRPLPNQNQAAVQYEPLLAGVDMPSTVTLSSADCGDYRSALKADFSDAKRIRFLGTYPKNCGERAWSIAYIDPTSFAAQAVRAMWEDMGGKLKGVVLAGQASREAKPLFAFSSPSLGEVIRDMNKFSNNVMAQNLFLSLSLTATSDKPATFEASRAILGQWWKSRFTQLEAPLVDNGSGLSRDERITAISLARLLQDAYAAPFMPELIASLPQSGVDGTLRRNKAIGIAHLKTGSLSNVAARAGYVHAQKSGREGKRYVLVAIVNSNNPDVISNSRSVFDTLINWTAGQ